MHGDFRLQVVAEQWRALGEAVKEAWAHANCGVALFSLSRMEEAGAELELGLTLFEEHGDRTGAVSASSFLCLARPTDPRVPEWLASALEFADAAGDRSKQITTLVTLAWHHFFRSFCGRPEDIAEAKGLANRLAELAEELGADDMAMHGRSLAAVMARMAGQLEEATNATAALERMVVGTHDRRGG